MSELENPLPPRTKGKKKMKKPPKKRSPIRMAILGLFLALLLAGGITAGYYYLKLEEVVGDISVGLNVEVPKEELASQKPISILLLGIDAREGLGLLNTDVIMVLALNPDRKTATIVSIPRDTYVDPTGWRPHKANYFYAAAYNDNKDTVFQEVKTIFGEMLSIPIDYASVVDFKTFEDMVDALGGLEIDVDKDMCYRDRADGTYINLKAGLQQLDGKEALDFVRYRQSNCGTAGSSDFERNQRQQQVISKVVEKVKSPTIILRGGGVLDAIADNVRTDIPETQIKSLIMTYAGISNDKINYIPLEGSWRSPYIYLDEEGLNAAISRLQEELDPSPPAQADEAATADQSDGGSVDW
ncbi:LytR family transcriptional regulator [Xylanibacillus composti]|uniref:LCP family protein n=1 Tax=Xylanibacillus composti TaxID=1572762 RepID=A0A8J4M1Z3_9BACL|nr:LCP family protein [Xylanibacillus composti]MDT9724391.1 LytR family transcriptional regulator [Xylanibacillus composti]GIQ67986.1 LCP family protein [Xylanibacillus composti]